MTKKDSPTATAVTPLVSVQALRLRAEALARQDLAEPPERADSQLPEATQKTLHELRVHQIELEMQNEELRRAQLQIDTERARYFDLYDLAPVGYCTLSEQGLTMETNLTAATLLGVTRSAMMKQPFSRFVLKADQDIYYLYRKLLLESGQAQSCELRMVKHDGTTFWVQLVTSVAQNADGVALQRVMLSDISEHKRLDQALQEKNLELERARQLADKANRAKSDFLSTMSHELRSPLNAILGFAQLMELGSPPPTPTQKARIDHILQAGWYLLRLINEILDLALIESGNPSVSMEAMPLHELLRECETMIEPQAQKSGISVKFPQFDGACFVSADRIRLKQAVVNLLSNAIKYNRVGGTVEMTIGAQPDQRLRISVQDSGEGLPPEKLAQLFQPFNRLGQETTAVEGTGIGLVVCKRLVELMGGSIGVQSTVGVGSVFWIELDQAKEPAPTTSVNEKNSEICL